eukprot:TRINITY_DN14382_c0_g2_i1.p1 TRINITY_DN14382_c0_g2~~TRINITY_DN14382_c0_g2_i1.p1  ORF type:complete len:384 (+),score=160.11 TRINITY_DN14382_c0_g2_i1:45-1196(+)
MAEVDAEAPLRAESVESIAQQMKEAADEGVVDVVELCNVLMKVTTVASKADVMRFYELGGVTSFCRLVKDRRSTDAKDVDFKLLVMIIAQTLLGVGQLRSYILLQGALENLTNIATTLLLMIGIEGEGGQDDLVTVHLEAAGCLNMLPLSHTEWVDHDIPGICMMLLADTTYPNVCFEVEGRGFGASNLLDAGLLLTTNFCASEEFFDRMVAAGLVEQLVSLAEEMPEAVWKSGAQGAVLVRLLSLLLIVVGIPSSRQKLDFLSANMEESKQVVRGLVANLAEHPNVMVRSLAHQVLAEYAGVTECQHEWITESTPNTQINQTEPSFNITRICSNPACGKEEDTPLSFKWCAVCKVTAYCSPACQKQDWKRHKLVCPYVAIRS